MIIGGYQKRTEVVEVISSRSTPSYGELPTLRFGAVGIMFGDVPILCGGSLFGNSRFEVNKSV